MDYYHYFDQRLDNDELFYKYWDEEVYGEDQYGHPLVTIRVKDIDVQAIADMDPCVACLTVLAVVGCRTVLAGCRMVGLFRLWLTDFLDFAARRCCGCKARNKPCTVGTRKRCVLLCALARRAVIVVFGARCPTS